MAQRSRQATNDIEGSGPNRGGLVPLWVMGVLCVSTLVWSLPLVRSHLAGVMDLPLHYQWAAQFERSLHEGVWFPRWNAASNQGLGDATFLHIHPLFYYLVAGVNAVLHDLWLAMRVVVMAAHLALGGVVYGLAQGLWRARRPALLCALAAQWAPYFLLMVVYGQAFPTLVALPFLAVLLGVVAARQVSVRLVVVGSLALVGTMLSHVLVAFTGIVCISLAMAVLFMVGDCRGEALKQRVQRLVAWLLMLISALGLSAWYLVPAVLGRAWINPQAWVLGDPSSPGLAWTHNAIYPLVAVLRGESTNLPLLWLLPLPPTAIAVVAAYRLSRSQAWRGQDALAPVAMALLAVAWGAVFFASGASAWLWAWSGVLQQLQFPWRFLGVLSLAGALLLGHAVFWPQGLGRRGGAGLVLGGLTLGVSAYLLVVTATQGVQVAPSSRWLTGQFGQPEYLPAAVPSDWQRAVAQSSVCGKSALPDGESCETVQDESQVKRFILRSAQPTTVVLPVFFHPGGSLTVDGQAWAVAADGPTGLVRVALVAGTHELHLYWSGTALDKGGKIISALSVLLCTAGLLGWRWRRSRLRCATVA